MNRLPSKKSEYILLLLVSTWILSSACAEFYKIAWGTGIWLGQFSFKWFLFFIFFVLLCIAFLGGVILSLWFPEKLASFLTHQSRARDGLKTGRWILIVGILIAPVYFFQYTPWGMVIDTPSLRITIWAFSAILISWLLSAGSDEIIPWKKLLAAFILTSGVYYFSALLGNVTSYPFSLGWSEGNRLWDYSILFGRSIYEYPADKTIPVYLDIGRQLSGGIPFLIPGITIWQERLWIGLINIIPYLILGWIAFKLPGKNFSYWILTGIWAFTFVQQGPIHPPLLLCAILVAVARGRPLWFAIPLIIGAGYFAQLSRSTWLFAPGMWAVMLEFAGAPLQDGRLDKKTWVRGISVGLAGIFGGYLIPKVFPIIVNWIKMLFAQPAGAVAGGGVSIAGIQASVSDQPLLWYRLLLPNPTNEYGILFWLILAVAPLIVILIHLSVARHWVLNTWQKLAIILPLFAFLVVGFIVSAKIGGGGDLHNLDMFIIGLMFAGAIAWRNSARDWIDNPGTLPVLARTALLLLVMIPAYQPYMYLQPNVIAEADLHWVMTLADIPRSGPFPESLPSKVDTAKALDGIRHEVITASQTGDVLFMDQRQLLTFGYITDVPLVPEYDKKVLMDKALSRDAQYFEVFYQDLASQRFSLIVTHPLHEIIQTSTDDFNEENNAWVKWVSIPVLCYYEPLETLRKVTVQLLTPRPDISGCAQLLP